MFEKHKWQICRVVVWNQKECTDSLSKYPNFIWSHEVIPWMIKYYYQATQEEVVDHYIAMQEHIDSMRD